MAVNYREVNMQLFQCLGRQNYFAKAENLWGVSPKLKLADDSSKVTAIIAPWVFIVFSHVRLVYQLRQGSIKKEWLMKF